MTDSMNHELNRRTLLQASAAGLLATGLGRAGPSAAAQDATPTPQDVAEGFSPEIQLALHDIVERNLAATETPGILIGVWYPGQGSWQHAGGIGNLETGAPVMLEDHVRIASNTKTFVATVVPCITRSISDGLTPFAAHRSLMPSAIVWSAWDECRA